MSLGFVVGSLNKFDSATFKDKELIDAFCTGVIIHHSHKKRKEISSFFGIPSKATPGVALEVEQPGIAQLSPGISNLITELGTIRNLDFTVFEFPAKKFVYIYCMLKKTGSSFLRYTSYLTKTAHWARVFRLSFRFL